MVPAMYCQIATDLRGKRSYIQWQYRIEERHGDQHDDCSQIRDRQSQDIRYSSLCWVQQEDTRQIHFKGMMYEKERKKMSMILFHPSVSGC